ncbi:hypothetical protein L2Y94_13665 [Luteibacter aegosomatis]|uniref:hypothetical protein n=1 Tax=Luteibacter aegosomatis TaxID=2911537 RepID=UPI001FFA7839|nr:hypothetical protein [Luteibacter aegosomatis]UPG84388.1 hypothetical protein L2Y94_13665 [Luteibacter aegosomatis]
MDGRRIGLSAVLVVLSLLTGCATTPPGGRVAPAETAGEMVARHLRERYDEEHVADCGSSTRPAFLCSGILLRSTEYSPAYHSWIPNPQTASWGVSFSWLREDSNFPENFPSANGFIVLPWFYADDQPGQYVQLNVRCIYPQDAWTGEPDRCRRVCQDLGVTTAEQWLQRYTDDADQCAFGVEQGRQNTADAWTQVGKVRYARRIFRRNEVIVEAWPQDVGAKMPIEAFFYRDNCYDQQDCDAEHDLPVRLDHARADQRDFMNATGRWVPIIRWTPATSFSAKARFGYNPGDQAITH